NTALIHAANIGNDIALEILVRHFRRLGLQVDHYNLAGYTALHIAARNGFLQCAKILAVKGKASLTLKDKVNGLTPLDWSLKEGYQKSEVEFLKPSAKFYRLAKLTTTMAKCRKKSSVTSQESFVPHITGPTSPTVKSVDKAKGKVRSLLKKSSASAAEDSEFMAIGSGCVPKQSKSGASSKTSLSKTAGFDTSKSKIGGGKISRSKASKQRSLTSSNSKDNVLTSKSKTALQHSVSQPCPDRSDMIEKENIVLQKGQNCTDHSKLGLMNHVMTGLELHGEITAELDSEDGSSCSDTETFSLRQSLEHSLRVDTDDPHRSKEYGNERSSSSDADRSSYGIASLSQYTDGGVYCGDIKPSDLEGFSNSPVFISKQNTRQLNSSTPSVKKESDCISVDTNARSSGGLWSPATCESFVERSPCDILTDRVQATKTGFLGNEARENEERSDSLEYSGSSLLSLSTKIEVLDKDENFEDRSLPANPVYTSNTETEIKTKRSKVQTESYNAKGSRAQNEQIFIDSSDATDDSYSLSNHTDITEISATTQANRHQVQKRGTMSSYASENPAQDDPQVAGITMSTNRHKQNFLSEKSGNDYLDLSSSAVYTRRLQTKAKSKELHRSEDSQQRDNDSSVTIDKDLKDDDPNTDETYLLESRCLPQKQRTAVQCARNHRDDTFHGHSSGFRMELQGTTQKETNDSDTDDETIGERQMSPCTEIDFYENSVAEQKNFQQKDSSLFIDRNIKCLKISQEMDTPRVGDHDTNCNESKHDLLHTRVSEKNKSTSVVTFSTGIHSQHMRDAGEQSTSRIEQYPKDTRHVNFVT
ncbi:ankyrin repeat domain-containing protein 63, partial [Plakobranchus ocellatus]